ncbi:MAG: type IX secretion system membrane protein PorP/SprF [Pedobacter sp.]|nr:MAG: type IX secretion system membrane protein PorP/SprF [Pedobacter sp.]
MKPHFIKKTILILSLILAGLKPARAQQNIQFTQYIFNSLSVNPAYAGYKEEWFGQMAIRTQWVGLEGAPKTGQFSFDGILDPVKKRMGLGIQIASDKLGPQSATSAYVNYAYRLRLNVDDTERLSFGLGVGITNYGLDGTKLAPGDAFDPSMPVGQIYSMIPDGRFGMYYHNAKFYAGLSVMDLFSGDNSNTIFNWDAGTAQNLKRKRHLYFIAGMLSNLSEEVKLKPSILLKEDFKGPTSLDLNAMLIFKDRFWIGGAYRTGVKLYDEALGKTYDINKNLSNLNSVSGLMQFYITNKLRLGYSYDFNLNRLNTMSYGTHEISLGITFPKNSGRLLSPRFF